MLSYFQVVKPPEHTFYFCYYDRQNNCPHSVPAPVTNLRARGLHRCEHVPKSEVWKCSQFTAMGPKQSRPLSRLKTRGILQEDELLTEPRRCKLTGFKGEETGPHAQELERPQQEKVRGTSPQRTPRNKCSPAHNETHFEQMTSTPD